MIENTEEVVKRTAAALAAIKRAYGTADAEHSVNLFVSHHLDELEGDYWRKHLHTTHPEPARILDIIELRSHWSADDEDGMDVFDFTLPDDVTDYVITVRFGQAGQIEEIDMES